MIVTEIEICETALKKFGLEKQIIKCVEELSELQKELCKLSLEQGNLKNTIEEIADVEIMLSQMKIGLKIGIYELTAAKRKKFSRLSEKLKGKEELLTENERKCQHCLYDMVTKEIFDESGADPCETCGADCCNWKAKEEPNDV